MFGKRYRRKEATVADKWMVIQRDKLQCVQCKTDLHLNPTKYPSVKGGCFHHIIPMVYGGDRHHPNLCLLCTDCHNQTHSGDEDKRKYFAMFETFIRTGKLF